MTAGSVGSTPQRSAAEPGNAGARVIWLLIAGSADGRTAGRRRRITRAAKGTAAYTARTAGAGTRIGFNLVAGNRTVTVAVVAVTGTVIAAAGIREVVAFAVCAATGTVRRTNASYTILPAAAAVIISRARITVLGLVTGVATFVRRGVITFGCCR